MKKLRYLLFLIGIIFIPNVSALQIGGVDYSMPTSYGLFDNLSSTQSNAVTTSTLISTEDTGITGAFGTVSTSTTGFGASWCVSSPVTFKDGYIYSVQVILKNVNGNSFAVVTNNNYDMLRLGYSLSDASLRSGTTFLHYFGVVENTHGIFVANDPIDQINYVLTYLFTAKLNAQYICLPFRHYQNTTNQEEWLYGLKVDVIGQDNLVTNDSLTSSISNSGLATATSVNEVQTSINQVKTEIQNTESAVNNVNDSINNSNVDDPSSSINSFQNMLANNGVITQLVTLPVTLFSNVLNSVNGTCSNYNLGSLLGTDLIFPCINISDYIGSTLWNVIDVLISGLFVYAISRKFIKVFENLSSMKEGDVISD